MPTTPNSILALDVGEKRIGIALASREARLPSALTTLANDGNFTDGLREIVENNAVDTLVIGLPRGLNGQDTAQTSYVREFAKQLETFGLPVIFQDEAVTSAQAESELRERGKPYTKEDVDSLSALYILDDYLQGDN